MEIEQFMRFLIAISKQRNQAHVWLVTAKPDWLTDGKLSEDGSLHHFPLLL
jgi:hypothetical protein